MMKNKIIFGLFTCCIVFSLFCLGMAFGILFYGNKNISVYYMLIAIGVFISSFLLLKFIKK